MDNIDLAMILAQVLNFLILFMLFKKFIADRLNNTIKARRLLMSKLEDAKKDYEIMLNKAHEDKNKIIKGAKKEASALFLEIEDIARTKEHEIIARANKRAKSIISLAEMEIENDKKAMISDMKEHIIDLSLRLNAKLFTDQNVDKDFMRKELSKLG